ncbi:MAG: hypothetical protein WC848_01335 [Parcubacteria group bacterium]|jgi:hypothetical protein
MNNIKISEKIDVYCLDELSYKVYWAFDQLETDTKDRFKPSDVANFLIEEKGIKTSVQAVRNILKRKKSIFHCKGGSFKMMEKGRQDLSEAGSVKRVIFIDADKPFSAKKNETLRALVSNLRKEVKICDPYVDVNTLDFIFHNFNKKVPIKVLTANIIDKPKGFFKRQLDEIKQEGFKIEVRAYHNSILHDRYIMDGGNFWLSGNSLNYLGKKESFIVALGSDIRQSMVAVFNSRWKSSAVI